MDSPGWFDSGYVVPGTDSDIGGKKIFTNYNNTRMYFEGQTSVIEEDFREHWYLAKTYSGTYSLGVGNANTHAFDYSDKAVMVQVYSNYNNTRSRVGSRTFEKSWNNVSVTLAQLVQLYTDNTSAVVYQNNKMVRYPTHDYVQYLIS